MGRTGERGPLDKPFLAENGREIVVCHGRHRSSLATFSRQRIVHLRMRLEDFRTMGIQDIWLLAQEERAAFVDAGLRRMEGSRVEVPGGEMTMDWVDGFAALD